MCKEEYKDIKKSFESEIDQGIKLINEAIKKYNIVEPDKNVCTIWANSTLIICFSENYWPISER